MKIIHSIDHARSKAMANDLKDSRDGALELLEMLE